MERLKPLLRYAGYSAWFSLMFLVFLWFTFPWGRVSDNITVSAADNSIAFSADSLRPAIVGARARGLIVGPLSKEEGGAPWLQAEMLKVKTGIGGALGALLTVRAISAEGGAASQRELMHRLMSAVGAVDVDGEMYGAEVTLGLQDEEKEAMRVALATGRLDLSAYALPPDLLSGSPQGRLQADADVLWHWEDSKKTSGSVDLRFTDLQLEGLKVAGRGLPPMLFSRAEAHLKMAKGRAEFRNTAFESDVFDLEVDGFINLKPNLLSSTLSLRIKFKVREDLEGMLSIAGLKETSRHRDTDGWFHYQGQGRLTKPRFTERRVARGASGSRARNARAKDVENGEADDEPASSAASRRTSKRVSADEDENEEPISREPMDEQRRQEIEDQRASLREERLRRREERRAKREELMEKRRQAQEAGEERETFDGRPAVPIRSDDFDRTNDLSDEVVPEDLDEGEEGEEGEELDEGEEGDYEE